MSISQTIAEDLKKAMREKNDLARDTLRMLKSDLGAKEVELGRPLTEAEELAVLQRAVKTREDSAEQYDAGGRADLAAKERSEIAIVQAYLPKAMDEAEARKVIVDIAAQIGATTKKDLGRLMKAVLDAHKGRIDGKLASKLAGEILS